MNKIKKLLISVGTVLALGAVSVTALAASDFGSTAVKTGTSYTLTQMLTYAVQDEYLAKAEYVAINEALGTPRPFANIVNAEQTHIAALEKLFATYGIALPDNSAETYVTVPAGLTDALNAGVQAEKNNIAMYEQFLSQSLPDDVKTVFTALKKASEQHLTAFERNLSGSGGNQSSGGSARGSGNRGYGMNGSNADNCSGTCTGTGACSGTASGRMNHGQGNGTD